MSRGTPRPIEDFHSVFRAIGAVDDPVILVGGHAVNLWALSYKDRLGDALPRYEPLMSGDLDLFTTVDALRKLHDKLGGEMYVSPPREITTGLLVLGVEPDTLEVDILRTVNGIPNPTVQDVVALDVCGHQIDVPFPHILLQAKLANSLQIKQDGRQDVKHAKVASLVTGAFIRESVETATADNARDVLTMLQAALKTATSAHAREFAQRHGHECLSDIPLDAIAQSPLPRLVNFTEHQLPRILAAYRGTSLSAEKDALAALRNHPESTIVSNERDANDHPAPTPETHPDTASREGRGDRSSMGPGDRELATGQEGPGSEGPRDDRGDVSAGRGSEEADRLKQALLLSPDRAERLFQACREHVEIDVFGLGDRRGFRALPERVQIELSEAAARYGDARQFFASLQAALAHAQEDPALFAQTVQITAPENGRPIPDGATLIVFENDEYRCAQFDILPDGSAEGGPLKPDSYSPEYLMIAGYLMPPGLDALPAGRYLIEAGRAQPEDPIENTIPMSKDHVGDYARCSDDTRGLREEKERLYAQGFPIIQAQATVAKYYSTEKFAHLRSVSNPVYFCAPSTTGENILPYILAQNLRRDFGGVIMPDWATPQALTRTAEKTGIEKLREPPTYKLNKDALALVGRDATVVLVDDVVTTGGSVQGMREALAQAGLRADHVTSLAQSELRLVRDADIDRITIKLLGNEGRDAFARSRGFADFSAFAAKEPHHADPERSGFTAWLRQQPLRADVALALDGRLKHLANYIETSIRKTDADRNAEISAHFRSEAQRLRELGRTDAGAVLGITERLRMLEGAQPPPRPGTGLDTGVSREGGAVRPGSVNPEGRDAAAAGNPPAVTEPAKPLQASETLDRLTALRLEYADNPDKHVLTEARGIAEAVTGPDVTRVPFTVSAVEYVKGNISRADLEQLAAKNERAAAHDKSPKPDRSQDNDLGR